MNNSLRWLALAAAAIGMGMSMPSCPGQQAMQQQIDSLQNSHATVKKDLAAMKAKVDSLSSDNEKIARLLEQMTNSIQAQKTALDQLDQTVKALAAKPSAPSKTKKRR